VQEIALLKNTINKLSDVVWRHLKNGNYVNKKKKIEHWI
jgi:hypothetical protein